MKRTFKLPTMAAAALLGLMLGATACGSDGGDAPPPTTEPAVSPAMAEFCDNAAEAQSLSGGPFRDPTRTLEEFNQHAAEVLDRVQASAPSEVAEPIGVIVQTYMTIMNANDPSIIPSLTESDDFLDADDELDAFLVDNCSPVDTIEVEARDESHGHFYEGVPSGDIPYGLVVVVLTNAGNQDHEMVLSPGPNQPPAGYVTTHPGQTEMTLVNLSPGDYEIRCDVPDAEHGGTHADMGMAATLEVT